LVAACDGKAVYAARVVPPPDWLAMVILPVDSLATSKARAVLPEQYSRADAVANIQAASLLGLAFAQGRGDLLRPAMADRIHQPYRSEICPLLSRLLPLAGSNGVLGVALSGAGPSVLLILAGDSAVLPATEAVRDALVDEPKVEILVTGFEACGGQDSLQDGIQSPTTHRRIPSG
jgi:homoserine kinase